MKKTILATMMAGLALLIISSDANAYGVAYVRGPVGGAAVVRPGYGYGGVYRPYGYGGYGYGYRPYVYPTYPVVPTYPVPVPVPVPAPVYPNYYYARAITVIMDTSASKIAVFSIADLRSAGEIP